MTKPIFTYLIHKSKLTHTQLNIIKTTLSNDVYEVKSIYSQHFRCKSEINLTKSQLNELRLKLNLDINLLPKSYNKEKIKLVLSDMDSTLIAIECIDEIADILDLKPEVSAITEAAMNGEIEFEESLKKRVSLLKGISIESLDKVYTERLRLNSGAIEWIRGLKQKKINFALVSGGFTYFTERLKMQYKLEFARANVLGEEDNKLTGKVEGDIIGAKSKAEYLHELCKHLKIETSQVIAIGDGANDILMLQEAGLSIAFHAKPTVQDQADIVINIGGLDSCLDLLV